MTRYLNAQEAHGLYMSMLDLNMAEYGAYTMSPDTRVRYVRGGNVHLGDSGMLYVGHRRPTTGYG